MLKPHMVTWDYREIRLSDATGRVVFSVCPGNEPAIQLAMQAIGKMARAGYTVRFVNPKKG